MSSGRSLPVALAALLTACGGGSLPPTHYYTLQPPSEIAGGSGPRDRGLVVAVDTFDVDPPYDQDRLVFRRGRESAEVGFYAYHRWASPLGRLAATGLADGLRGAEGIRSIEPARSGRQYTARLGGRVIYLEELDLPGEPRARVAIELELREAGGEILWAATLTAQAGGQADSGTEMMAHVHAAFARLVADARRQIEAALAAGPAAP